ncbi:hypothetical protein HDK90DRAFT_214799 [Phyllosticta capitalensis]|uniref:RING-CH-type domain-containing protein n=1 Tax=Phyllosticta capitalensis TaxID=121624 RepID=A0ABR1YT36_9PEZI
MASVPHHPASQRRSSQREPGSSSDATVAPVDHEAFSTTSVDSDTILFNSAHQTLRHEAPTPQVEAASTATPSHQQSQAAEEDDTRRCWICFNDESEDAPGSSAWRSPCPCALVAHEDCLLDWVASQEAPNARRQAGSGSKITCPQCKNEIHLKRPRSLVVEGVRAVEKFTGYFVLPGTVSVLGYTVWQACFMHGVSTVYAVFGLRDGYRILAPLHQYPVMTARNDSVALTAISRFLQHARLHFGLTTIPPILIASRLSIADSILPILPVIFLASYGPEDFLDFNQGRWPPSASLCFSLLPYIRAAYNTYMEKAWGKKQRQWLKEMQPRAGETEDAQAVDDLHDADPLDQGGDILDLELDVRIDIGDDEDDDDGDEHFHDDFHVLPGEPRGPNDVHPFEAPPLADNDPAAHAAAAGAQAQGPGQGAQQQQQPNAQPRPRARPARERNLIWQGTNLADTVLGALVFPSIAAAVGELLRLGLPKSWTTPPPARLTQAPTGFLQHRWARSLVGGCLFVAVKDAVMLYVRWRMAQSHRRRKVLDYDKKKGRVVEV